MAVHAGIASLFQRGLRVDESTQFGGRLRSGELRDDDRCNDVGDEGNRCGKECSSLAGQIENISPDEDVDSKCAQGSDSEANPAGGRSSLFQNIPMMNVAKSGALNIENNRCR